LEKNTPSPATLQDVARLAGVSYQTVSRVINHSPNVSPKTLEKVNQAITALNYQPNRIARSLATGRSNAIHVMAVNLYNLGMLPAIFLGASSQGYQLTLTGFPGQAVDSKDLEIFLSDIITSQVDGIIFLLPWRLASGGQLKAMMHGTPFVVVGNSLGYGTDSVMIDQKEGMRLAVQHLLDLGHRRIATIHGPEGFFDAQLREETLVKILHQFNLDLIARDRGDFTMRAGYEAAIRLLGSEARFTALVCANDDMALGAMRAIKEKGLRIPQDISVVGFDDQNFAAYCDPPLTTIRQDFHALGMHSFQHLVSLIKTPETTPHQRLLFPELVVRQSTAAPAKS
jgi:LacI family transcriptional regulator